MKKLQNKKISIQCNNEHFEVFHFGFLAYYVQLLHIYVNAINNIAVICVVIHPIASTGLKFKNLGKLQNHHDWSEQKPNQTYFEIEYELENKLENSASSYEYFNYTYTLSSKQTRKERNNRKTVSVNHPIFSQPLIL